MQRLATGPSAATVAGDSAGGGPRPVQSTCGSYAPMADAASWLCEGVTTVE